MIDFLFLIYVERDTHTQTHGHTHKNPVSFRPIFSYNYSLFEKTSNWSHYQLLPILLQKQYLKDFCSLIKTLESLQPPLNSLIFTFDVETL